MAAAAAGPNTPAIGHHGEHQHEGTTTANMNMSDDPPGNSWPLLSRWCPSWHVDPFARYLGDPRLQTASPLLDFMLVDFQSSPVADAARSNRRLLCHRVASDPVLERHMVKVLVQAQQGLMQCRRNMQRAPLPAHQECSLWPIQVAPMCPEVHVLILTREAQSEVGH